jgi:hypothetical protein
MVVPPTVIGLGEGMAGVTRIWPPKGMVNGSGKVASSPDTEVDLAMTGSPPGPVTVTTRVGRQAWDSDRHTARLRRRSWLAASRLSWRHASRLELQTGPWAEAHCRAEGIRHPPKDSRGERKLLLLLLLLLLRAIHEVQKLPGAPAKLSWRPHTTKPGMGVGVMVLLKKALRMVPSPPSAPAAVGVRSRSGRA